MLHSWMVTPTYIYSHIYIYTYALLLLYSCFTSRYICNCCNPALLKYLYLCSCFTPDFTVFGWL